MDVLNGGVVGVFIAPTTNMTVGGGRLFDGAPDSPVPQPRHQFRWIPTVEASDFWARLDVRCTPDIYCSLSGAPVWARLTSARTQRALNAPQRAVGAEIAVAPWMHRTVRCTPDSPVNYSGAAGVKTRGWRVPKAALPWSTGQSGAHRTVRCPRHVISAIGN